MILNDGNLNSCILSRRIKLSMICTVRLSFTGVTSCARLYTYMYE